MRSYPFFLLLFLFQWLFTAAVCSQSTDPEKIADGFVFTEGPLWYKDALYFSDIPANTIYKWTPEDGLEVAIRPSSNSNGLAATADGRLLIAQHKSRRLVRLENDDSMTTLASRYDGKRLNSPNDIAVHPDGSIYFTDPFFGITPEQEELGFYGVYCIEPNGQLRLLEADLDQPNGIAFSPDFDKLYISTSFNREVWVYDVVDLDLNNKKLFASQTNYEGASDGMVTGPDGNLYLAGPDGVWIYAPNGELEKIIPVPGQTSNVAWGPEAGKTLFVTSEDAVYRINFN